MKLYPHPRPLPVLLRIRSPLVLSGPNPSNASLSTPHIAPWRATTPLHPAFSPFDPTQISLLLIPLHPLRPIQST
jgi:hypothetical protein